MFLKLPFAVSFSVLYVYFIYICIYIYKNTNIKSNCDTLVQ